MKILGIDPGLTSCGYCILDHNDLTTELIYSDFLNTNPKDRIEIRLSHLYRHFADSVIPKYKPDIVAIEDQFVGKNHDVTMKIVMAKTACLLAGANNKLPVIQFKPSVVKYAITRDGKATKEKIKKKIERLFGRKIVGPDDVTDAIAIAITGTRFKP